MQGRSQWAIDNERAAQARTKEQWLGPTCELLDLPVKRWHSAPRLRYENVWSPGSVSSLVVDLMFSGAGGDPSNETQQSDAKTGPGPVNARRKEITWLPHRDRWTT